jgi:sugar/nucleoside kinase (ribokinase family)
LGLRAAFVGTAGDDDHAQGLCEALETRGVDTTLLIRRAARHRRAIILVNEQTGDRTVLWERDARLSLDADELPRAIIESTRLLHVDDVDEDAAVAAAAIARKAGIPVTSDIDHVNERTRALVDAVTVPIFAEHVPQALSGELDPERALRRLRNRHDGLLCVTLGVRGSMLLDGNQLYRVPAPGVHAVDATGAGDVFRGAFICALLRGDSPVDILRFANAAAALSCTREGALDSVPTRQDVEEFLRR